QPVTVNEPSVEETVKILHGLQSRYEDYHHVHYSDAAIKAAVTLSARYIQDRFLPDKAIDLLDESGSKKNLTLNDIDPKVLDEKIQSAESQKQEALQQEDYERAAYFRDQIEKLQKMKSNQSQGNGDRPEITEKDMEKIVEEKTHIPVGELRAQEQEQLKNLSAELESKVIGKDKSVDKVDRFIR